MALDVWSQDAGVIKSVALGRRRRLSSSLFVVLRGFSSPFVVLRRLSLFPVRRRRSSAVVVVHS